MDGLEWVKVSTISEKKIIYDLAKAGVGAYSSDESEDQSQLDDDDEPEGLVKFAKSLLKASRLTRVRYKHPRIRLVLTRINKNCLKGVADVIEQIRALGVVVQTADNIPSTPSLSLVLTELAPDAFRAFSEIINVDLTILLAFVSDISHGRVQPADWHHKFVSQQRELEANIQLVPLSLWPACSAKRLQCSSKALVRMQEIVHTMGTDTERQRMEIMMGVEGSTNLSREQRIQEFQTLTEYNVPLDWVLPIEVVDVNLASMQAKLPPVAAEVAQVLSPINQTVFLYGWAMDITTISSNRVVSKEVEAIIEANRISDGDQGPDIWLCRCARSLVGKEKLKRAAGQYGDDLNDGCLKGE